MNKIIRKIECNIALSKIKIGDYSGFDTLYKYAGKQMYALAHSILNNHADAEDTLQESFIKIQQNIQDYDNSRDGYNWLLKITRNTAIDFLRRRKEHLNIEDFSEDENISISYQLEEKIVVMDELMRLDWEDREIVILKVFTGLKYKEISELTGKSIAIVQKRYQRSLIKIRENLLK